MGWQRGRSGNVTVPCGMLGLVPRWKAQGKMAGVSPGTKPERQLEKFANKSDEYRASLQIPKRALAGVKIRFVSAGRWIASESDPGLDSGAITVGAV